MAPRVTGRRAPASMRGRRAAARLAAEASMRASSSSSRVASRGELLARRLGVAAPGPRRDLTPGRVEHDRSSRDASTSPREWSIVPRGVPTVGFAASAIVASRGREERTARRSARGFAAVPSATPPDAPPRNRDRDEDRGKATLALDPETAPRPRRGPTATSRPSRTPCPSRAERRGRSSPPGSSTTPRPS